MREVMLQIPDRILVIVEERATQEGFESTVGFLSDFVIRLLAMYPDNRDLSCISDLDKQ
jgi:hypothetical protein